MGLYIHRNDHPRMEIMGQGLYYGYVDGRIIVLYIDKWIGA